MAKPGVSGWSQLNMRGTDKPEETVRLEYDLYYAKMGSAMLDASILLRLLFLTIASWIPRRNPARAMEAA
jgi:lipopolysaccharide/colanic/teichoic acid biosynthesis glycosyltransferase